MLEKGKLIHGFEVKRSREIAAIEINLSSCTNDSSLKKLA